VDEVRTTRLEQNQTLFTESHQMIEARTEKMRADFVCECSDPDCMQMIPLTLIEYEKLRATPGRFAVSPGHEEAGDRVVDTSDRYVVVERS
jgi:hypothetical protein